MYGSVEQMDIAEVLATIVERACLYTPEAPVGEMLNKKPKRPIKESEALSKVDNGPKEALTSVKKVPVDASNLVRFK